jgi:hypothetical protein
MAIKPPPAMHAGTVKPPLAMQAVVVIHGMGEQRPMDTIKGFVKAVWETDEVITQNALPHPTQTWSKPDVRTGSLELRRITTRQTVESPPEFPGGVRTDFYELYWADLTAGTPWRAFTGWVRGLLLRPISRVPRGVRSTWVFLWVVTLVILMIGALAALPGDVWQRTPFAWFPRWLFIVIVGALAGLMHNTATATFGRVVRYTRADPDNIAARQAVRERGLKLLRALHEGSYYKRIVIVSHSLGTMLAHDLLSYFWAERDAARKISESTAEFEALSRVEEAAAQLELTPSDGGALQQYFGAQRELRRLLAQREAPNPTHPHAPDRRWLISDFITLGSPLTHSEFLIASSANDLRARIFAREISVSPPFREDLDPRVLERAIGTQSLPIANPPEVSKLISFPLPSENTVWELHHAAPYAVVRWTNIFDPARFIFFGDIIGGPLRSILGPAIIDVDLRQLRSQSWSFTHTNYWSMNGELRHIVSLRKAVNLLDRAGLDPTT